MKYNLSEFNSAVNYYKGKLKGYNKKNILLAFDIGNFNALLSIAPLSKAIHELNNDLHVFGADKKSEVLDVLNEDYLKMTGIKAGCMANIPGGEAFVTPEYIKGIFVGDVVVHIDQSYALSEKNPLVVGCMNDYYKIIDCPKKL